MTFHADRHARVVIVGGGAVGCSLAWHLAEKGEKDVLLLEKAQLTHGSTWHAAGLVGQLRGKLNLTRLMQNSVAVFDRLEKATGKAIDWKKVGSLRLASSAGPLVGNPPLHDPRAELRLRGPQSRRRRKPPISSRSWSRKGSSAPPTFPPTATSTRMR